MQLRNTRFRPFSMKYHYLVIKRPSEKNEYHFNCFSVFDKLMVKINRPLLYVLIE